MKGSDFVFDCVHLMYYKYHKRNLNHGGLFTVSPDQIKTKKTTINPTNRKDNECFQYAITVALNHEERKKILQ